MRMVTFLAEITMALNSGLETPGYLLMDAISALVKVTRAFYY